jgi:sortase A
MSSLMFKKIDLASSDTRTWLWPVLLLILGLYQFGSAMAIYSKAILAQHLIAKAWRESLQQSNPVKPWSWADTSPLARLHLAGEDLYVLEGASGRVLAFGPGHMSQTSIPGSTGNSVIVGHRDTHFASLQYLDYGELIEVETSSGISQYQVIDLQIVDQNQTELLDDGPQAMLTLITCYPFDSLQAHPRSRYVVRAIKI